MPDWRFQSGDDLLHISLARLQGNTIKLASRRIDHGITAIIRRLCVPKQSLAMFAFRAYRAGCEAIHPLNSGSQYPEMEQIGTSVN